MKFNEEQLKHLLQNEPATWNHDDLSWFDQEYFEQIENKTLPTEERQRVIQKMANDQVVMNHYLTLKRAHNIDSKSTLLFWRKPIALAASVAGILMIYWLTTVDFNNNENIELLRSPTEFSVYPQNAKTLPESPTYLVAPPMDNKFKIKLFSDQKVIWETHELTTPRIYLPPEVRSQMQTGKYSWQVYNHVGELAHSYIFSID
jgi:hypothetical protein